MPLVNTLCVASSKQDDFTTLLLHLPAAEVNGLYTTDSKLPAATGELLHGAAAGWVDAAPCLVTAVDKRHLTCAVKFDDGDHEQRVSWRVMCRPEQLREIEAKRAVWVRGQEASTTGDKRLASTTGDKRRRVSV